MSRVSCVTIRVTADWQVSRKRRSSGARAHNDQDCNRLWNVGVVCRAIGASDAVRRKPVRFQFGSLLNPSAASLYRFNEFLLQHSSTDIRRRRLLQRINRAPLGRRASGACSVGACQCPGELLNRAHRRPAHREMRAERVAEDVRPVVPHVRVVRLRACLLTPLVPVQ
jgi:hypothetical protein